MRAGGGCMVGDCFSVGVTAPDCASAARSAGGRAVVWAAAGVAGGVSGFVDVHVGLRQGGFLYFCNYRSTIAGVAGESLAEFGGGGAGGASRASKDRAVSSLLRRAVCLRTAHGRRPFLQRWMGSVSRLFVGFSAAWTGRLIKTSGRSHGV